MSSFQKLSGPQSIQEEAGHQAAEQPRGTLGDLHGKLLLCKDGSFEGEDLSSILPTRFSKMSRELKKLWRMPRCSGCFAKR